VSLWERKKHKISKAKIKKKTRGKKMCRFLFNNISKSLLLASVSSLLLTHMYSIFVSLSWVFLGSLYIYASHYLASKESSRVKVSLTYKKLLLLSSYKTMKTTDDESQSKRGRKKWNKNLWFGGFNVRGS
jgi:predicted membrane protein